MQSAELEFIRFDSSDIITSSVPTVSGSLTLDCFGNNTKKDATVNGYFKGQTINFDSHRDGPIMEYLRGLYGDDFENVSNYFGDTPFKYGTGEEEIFSDLKNVIDSECTSDSGSDSTPFKYNGTYTFDSVSNMFMKQ